MTRDQFEAVLWRESGRKLTPAQVDAILTAADAYAARLAVDTPEATAERRRVLDLALQEAS